MKTALLTVLAAVASIVIALVVGWFIDPLANVGTLRKSGVRVFTRSELKQFDGSDPSKPLLLVVLGEVFDVTEGERHYSKGQGYNVFIGQDASRAFHSGEFDKVVEDVRDLSVSAMQDVIGWRRFYRQHATYRFVGVVEGLYYDSNGEMTPALDEVNANEQKAEEVRRVEDALAKRYPNCNMKYTRALEQTEIHCTPNEMGEARYPRTFHWTNKGTGAPAARCVCLTEKEINGQLPLPDGTSIDAIEGCEEGTHCVRKTVL